MLSTVRKRMLCPYRSLKSKRALHTRQTALNTMKRTLHTPKEPCISWNEPYIPWKEPAIPWKEPCIPWKEPYILSDEPHVLWHSPEYSEKKEYIPQNLCITIFLYGYENRHFSPGSVSYAKVSLRHRGMYWNIYMYIQLFLWGTTPDLSHLDWLLTPGTASDCCSVLQCVAVCCSGVQWSAVGDLPRAVDPNPVCIHKYTPRVHIPTHTHTHAHTPNQVRGPANRPTHLFFLFFWLFILSWD